MPNRYYTDNPDVKLPAGKKGGGKESGGKAIKAPATLHDSPPGYRPAGKGWASSFNRGTKWPVVKTRVAKAGLD